MMNSIFQHDGSVSRAITAENLSGKPGVGGQASSELGISRKGSPCLVNVPSGATVTIADIQGCGIIEHMWFTLAETTKSGDYMLRDVILKIYWDNEETPSDLEGRRPFNLYPSVSIQEADTTVIFPCHSKAGHIL